MYPLRSILVLLLFFFALNVVGELVTGPLMGDVVPTWKIAAVSLISALGATYQLSRRGLKPGDVFKYFRRSYLIPGLELERLYPALLEKFPPREFKVDLSSDHQEIRIRRKANWRSFGEVLSLKNIDSHLQLWIRPKYYIDVFDQGQAYESLLQLEQVLNTESYEA